MTLSNEELDKLQEQCDSQSHGVSPAHSAYIVIAKWRALIAQAKEANRLREENARMREVVEAAKAWGDSDADDPVAVLAAEFGLSNALTRLHATPPEREEAT